MTSKIPQRFKSSQGLAYIKVGSGPSLVLIHGVGLRLDAWLNQIDDLAQHFTVYAVDMPGHGESELFPECQDINGYTDVLQRWIKADVATPIVIGGHSMGSMIALNFAIRYRHDCAGVLALNSVFRRSDVAKKAVQSRVAQIKESITSVNVTAPVQRWFDFPVKGEDIEHAQLCSDWLRKASLDGYRQAYEVFCFNDGPASGDLESLDVPALFLTGRDDPNSTAAMSQKMAQLCPYGQSYVVENARHMAPMTHYQEINPIITKFGQECFDPKRRLSVSTQDPRALRNAFGSFMTGVTVVTAVSKTGEKVGFTANSFTSVSMDPPLLMVCPANKLSSYEVFEQCDHFAVSILAEGQQHESNTFAGSKGDRFAEVEWHVDEFGTPLIDGAVTHFSCSAFEKVPAGDHLMLVGKVESFTSNEQFGLGYAKGGYFSLGMEHKAEEVAHGECARVGALIESSGQLLVRNTETGYTLPATNIEIDKGSRASLQDMLTGFGGRYEVGQVFSVYEKTKTGNFIAFYCVESASSDVPEGYQFVALDELKNLTFQSSDLTSMVSRFVTEKQNGVFRLYFGNESEGDVR